MLEIIAEAAQGFLGDPARKTLTLVDYAAAATADAVKFQLVYADELCTRDYRHHKLFSELEMEDAAWHDVGERCRKRGIRLYCDVFGLRSLRLACDIGVAGIKLHSTDLLNRPLIHAVAAAPVERVILGAGGALYGELQQAARILEGKELTLMHGFQGYPTATDENQISRIALLRQQFRGCTIGFADHVPEDAKERCWLSAIAVGAGATVLEKHITTATVCREEDHESALNPDTFSEYAANMRLAFLAVGSLNESESYGMSPREVTYRNDMKKHVITITDLPAGATISEADIDLKRTSMKGDVFRDTKYVIGRRLVRDMPSQCGITPADIA